MAEKKKIKILLAEDDKFLSKVMSNKLLRKGFDVIIAGDGVEAVSKINFDKPDLVLLDLVMPNKDGFGVLEDIKKEGKFKKMPIIVLSNLGQDEDVKKAKSLGATDYMVKSDMPINEVILKIEKLLKK